MYVLRSAFVQILKSELFTNMRLDDGSFERSCYSLFRKKQFTVNYSRTKTANMCYPFVNIRFD